MTQDQAGEIATLLTAIFHRDALEPQTLVTFGKDLMLLDDGSVGLQAAHELGRAQDRFPTIREFRDAYHSVAKRRAHDRADERGLPEPSSRDIPEWVHVWWWARRVRDPREGRPFPQQEQAMTESELAALPDQPYLTAAEYATLRSEWEQAGAPRLGSAGQLVGAAVAR